MNFLLDTHILLWLSMDDPALKPKTRALLADRKNGLFVSIASIWEISIKQAAGKLRAPDNLIALLEQSHIKLLPISVGHAFAVRSLGDLHGDPFDRMLVAQAMIEDLTIVTRDEKIQAYAVACLKA